ncbi:IclR family transcriptional regulator [Limimaricola litoreus]|uniref:Helix-turn-helix domain-containing protein n=1 Tax=Limimaricola litoreus TaxID=2955316 RepID=A0A9X2FP38_9RHOB|nr:helix-turn-helix domain-containing protein [Limimaricola litoreus]MCP1169012.1 helix-turn-helix domain-containing protein [Limimaricola litoreus]
MAAGSTLQTLERGIAVLQAVAASETGLRIVEIAERLGVHRAIAYRLVNTLADQHMLRRLPEGKIVLGSASLLLGLNAEGALRTLARPIVQALADRTQATAFLSTAAGEEGVAVLTSTPKDAFLNINYRVGSRHPLTRGAAGIAILAGREATKGEPESVTKARELGYSLTEGQLQKGATGIASPVPMPREFAVWQDLSIGVVGVGGLDHDLAIKEVLVAAQDLAWAAARA